MKLLRLGLPALCLLMLGACSVKPQVIVKTELVILAPPAALLADCPETPIPARGTNADLLTLAKMLRIDLAECNRGKARLREWIAVEKGNQGAKVMGKD